METVELVNLPKIVDRRGNLSIIEEIKNIPFKIERVYWIYDVPGGEKRGGHAYRENEEFIVALSGSFDVILDDGLERKVFSLNRSYYGLYVPKGVWRQMDNFSTNSLALVLASTPYNSQDYIYDYEQFKIFIDGKSRVYDCNIVEMSKHHRIKGNMTVVENDVTVPFGIERVYYLYDVPGGESRGGHAHKELYQLIVAASGSFNVTLDDGEVKRSFTLNKPYQGLLIVPGIWRELDDFSSGAVCLVLASHGYDEDDYIRDYNEFLTIKQTK